jgi:hypothetical protein
MAAQIWDENIGPLVHQYWSACEEIMRLGTVKGLTNAQIQTIATGVLAERIAAQATCNTTTITCAAGLAANNYS